METTTLPAGCYVDGAWGHYGPARAVLVMLEAGWSPNLADAMADDALALVADAYLAMMGASTLQDSLPVGWAANAYDLLADASEAATLWADAHVPPHHWVGWLDGEYGCWPVGDGEDQ